MNSFIVIAALALTAAQASVLTCGSGLGLGLGLRGIQISGASSTPLAPRVVADGCQCTKTIVRPQLNQRVIDIPSTRRVVQNSISNTVQNIPYSAAGPVDSGVVATDAGFGYGLGAGLGYGLGAVDTVAPIATGFGLGAGYGYGLGAIDTVAPIATVSGYGAPLTSVVGSGFPIAAGYSGFNDAALAGDVIAPCGY